MHSTSGTGVTLRNLFANWPQDRIALIHPHVKGRGMVAPGTGAQHYELPASATPVASFLRAGMRSGKRALSVEAPMTAAVPLSTGAPASARLHANLRAALDLSPLLLPKSLRSFVDDFAPDVVYSLLGSSLMIRLAYRVSGHAGAPLVPHFMDDWLSTLYTSGELRGVARHRIMRQVDRVTRSAPLCLCISEAMSDEYRERLQRKCVAFVNPVPDLGDSPAGVGPSEGASFVYVGGLHLGRWDVLMEVARAISVVSPRSTMTVHAPESHLQGVSVPPDLSRVVDLGGSIPGHQVPERLSRADVLVHVESFEATTRRFTRLSLSTKVSQYLMSGRPILGVGPPEQASMDVIRDSGGGLAVNSIDSHALEGAIKTLQDPTYRQATGVAGRIYGKAHFDQRVVWDRLRNVLLEASGKG